MHSSSSRALLAAVMIAAGSLVGCGSGSADGAGPPASDGRSAGAADLTTGSDPGPGPGPMLSGDHGGAPSGSDVPPASLPPEPVEPDPAPSPDPVNQTPTPATEGPAPAPTPEPPPEPAWIEVSGVTAQAPGNSWMPPGFAGPWAYLRNVFAPAGLVDGRDYSLRQWHGALDQWPGEFRFEWTFPDIHPGDGHFCWGYPALMYGAGPWGYPWGTTGHPAPIQAGSFEAFTIDVDLAFNGTNGADLLIDVYTLPQGGVFTGANINEVSILLTHDGVGPLSWLTTDATATHTYASPLGDSAIYKQPTSTQIMVMPRSGSDRRAVLSGTIDVKEVLDHLISIGLVDADAWVAGFEIGVETQRPNAFNSAPYSGSLTFKRAPVVVWR